MFRVIQEMRQVKGIQIVRVRLKTVKNEVIGTVLNNDRFSVCNAESKTPDFCIGEHFIARRIMPIAIVKSKLKRKGIRQAHAKIMSRLKYKNNEEVHDKLQDRQLKWLGRPSS